MKGPSFLEAADARARARTPVGTAIELLTTTTLSWKIGRQLLVLPLSTCMRLPIRRERNLVCRPLAVAS